MTRADELEFMGKKGSPGKEKIASQSLFGRARGSSSCILRPGEFL